MLALCRKPINMTQFDSNIPLLLWPGRPPAAPLPPAPIFQSQGQGDSRLYACDNLLAISHLLPTHAGKIHLIYCDPPFNTGQHFALRGKLQGHAYSDRHREGMSGYLTHILPRLRAMRDLLTSQGTLYLHCDYRASSHLRLLLDEVFGEDNFRAQIIWHYQSGGRQKHCWSMKHDVIWMYSRSDKFTFNLSAVGIRRGSIKRNHMKQSTSADGKSVFSIRSGGRIYTYSEDDLLTPADVWTDISHLQQKDPERTGYATQKPEKLLERIILASSNAGETVADFYCGSGTTLATAQRLGRHWIGSDSGHAAIAVCESRLNALLPRNDYAKLDPLDGSDFANARQAS